MRKLLAVFFASLMLSSSLSAFAEVTPVQNGLIYDFERGIGSWTGASCVNGSGANSSSVMMPNRIAKLRDVNADIIPGITDFSYDVCVDSFTAPSADPEGWGGNVLLMQIKYSAWQGAWFNVQITAYADGTLAFHNGKTMKKYLAETGTWYRVVQKFAEDGYLEFSVRDLEGNTLADLGRLEFTDTGRTLTQFEIEMGSGAAVELDNISISYAVTENSLNVLSLDEKGALDAEVNLSQEISSAEILIGDKVVETVENNGSGSYRVSATGSAPANFGAVDVTMRCYDSDNALADTVVDTIVVAPSGIIPTLSDLTPEKASEPYTGTNYSDGKVTAGKVALEKDAAEGWLSATYKEAVEAGYHFVLSGDSNNRCFNGRVVYPGMNKASFEIYLPSGSSGVRLLLCVAISGRTYGNTNAVAVLDLNSSNLNVDAWTPVTVWHDVSGGTWRYQVGSAAASAWTTTGQSNNDTGFGGLAFKLNEVSTDAIRFRNYNVEQITEFEPVSISSGAVDNTVPASESSVSVHLGSLTETDGYTLTKDGGKADNAEIADLGDILVISSKGAALTPGKYTLTIPKTAVFAEREIGKPYVFTFEVSDLIIDRVHVAVSKVVLEENETVSAAVTVSNISAEKTAVVLLAAYDGDALVGLSAKEVTLPGHTADIVLNEPKLTIPKDSEYRLEWFIIDSFAGGIPFADVIPIE